MDESFLKLINFNNTIFLPTYPIYCNSRMSSSGSLVLTYPMMFVRVMDTEHFSFRVFDQSTYLAMKKAAGVPIDGKCFINPVNAGYQFKGKPSKSEFPHGQQLANKQWYSVTFAVKDWVMETDDCDVNEGKWAQVLAAEECEDPTAIQVETPAAAKNSQKKAVKAK